MRNKEFSCNISSSHRILCSYWDVFIITKKCANIALNASERETRTGQELLLRGWTCFLLLYTLLKSRDRRLKEKESILQEAEGAYNHELKTVVHVV